MIPIVFSRALAAASATALVNASGTVAALTNLTLVTTVLDTQRRVLFTPTGNEASNSFTIVGTNQAGNQITEVLAGANATTFYSNMDFKTVTRITPLNATADTLSVGTNGIGSSLWQIVNWNATPAQIGMEIEVRSGTATFQIDGTYDDPNNLLAGLSYPLPFTAIASGTTTLATTILYPITAIRLTTTAGPGTLWFRMLQSGLASP